MHTKLSLSVLVLHESWMEDAYIYCSCWNLEILDRNYLFPKVSIAVEFLIMFSLRFLLGINFLWFCEINTFLLIKTYKSKDWFITISLLHLWLAFDRNLSVKIQELFFTDLSHLNTKFLVIFEKLHIHTFC